MKTILLLAGVLGMGNACNKTATSAAAAAGSKDGYVVSGKLTNAPAGTKVYLAELGESQFISRDTATTDAQGRFTMKGTVPEAGLYQLKVNDQNQVLVALDNRTNLQLTGDATKLGDNYTVKGSKESEQMRLLGLAMQRSKTSMAALEKNYNRVAQAGRTDSMHLLEAQYYAMQARNTAEVKQLVRQNPASVVSAFAVTNLINADEHFGFVDSVATQLNKAMPTSRYSKALQAKLGPMRSTAVGSQAPEINLASPDGKPIALSSLRGKYVLIDFWASWCGPCRQENPNVVRAYQKFKPKGFEIYSVSLDQNKDKWLKAIQDDQLAWTHVSDLQGWGSVAGQAYGVKSIPQSVLLDPQGKIIAKNLRGQALETKLAAILK